MTTKLALIVIEYLNRRYPDLCREIVVGTGAHVHRNPRRKVRSLGPVEIITSDGLSEGQAGHDFGGQL